MKPRLIMPSSGQSQGEQHITRLIEETGYKAAIQEDKGRYYEGMIHLAGSLNELRFLRDQPMLRLFSNAQIRKGAALTYRQLKDLAQPGESLPQFESQMFELTLKHMFVRGYALQCPFCALDNWFELAEVAETVACKGCHAVLQLPLDLNFAYQANPIFSEGLRQGALSVLLTALWLSERCQEFLWKGSYLLKKGQRQIEIDLIALCDGKLVIAECKDTFAYSTYEERAALDRQLQQSLEVAQQTRAQQVLFATLRDDLPAGLMRLLAQPDLQVQALTRHDLLQQDI